MPVYGGIVLLCVGVIGCLIGVSLTFAPFLSAGSTRGWIYIAAAGADGFIFEPYTRLDTIVERYGKTHVIVGNVDTRILTFGTHDQIRAEVKRCADLGRDCPGYFFAVGNHIPYNVPIPAVECYLDAIREMGTR